MRFDMSKHRRRARLRTMAIIFATALVIAPATALASNSFSDVDSGEFFHGAVDWAKANGVTVGCNPPDNTRFCPNDFVTRGQMAVFLQRLDTEDVFLRPGDVPMSSGGGDADTLDGKDSTEFLLKTQKAADADKLDGLDSTAFLGATDKATDADKLDGVDGADYATDAEIDGFLPIAVFTVTDATDGDFSNGFVNYRAPITGPPTISGSNGRFVIDFPGFEFDRLNFGSDGQADSAVCTALIRDYEVVVDGSSGDLVVELYDQSGVLETASDDDFTCAVYAGG